jgi:hypothetical protein
VLGVKRKRRMAGQAFCYELPMGYSQMGCFTFMSLFISRSFERERFGSHRRAALISP